MIFVLDDDDKYRLSWFKKFFSNEKLDIATNVPDAMNFLRSKDYNVIFLDHDLGGPFVRGADGDGIDVAKMMVKENLQKGAEIWLHSCNPHGRANMYTVLTNHGYSVEELDYSTLRKSLEQQRIVETEQKNHRKETDTVYYKKLADDICQWIIGYCKENFIKSLVIGVSGGVDSAVVVFLCNECERLSRDSTVPLKSIYISMPFNIIEDADSYLRSVELCKTLKAELWVYEILSIVEAYQRCMTSVSTVQRILFDKNSFLTNKRRSNIAISKINEGNLRARVRTNILYDIAKDRGGIVVGTGNLDENKIGYFTKGGDGLADILPLGKLHKYEVYGLAAVLNVPKSIIDAAPSGGLWAGQTDQDELGMTYEEIAYAIDLLDGKESTLSLAFPAGKLRELKNKVERLITKNSHKMMIPPCFEK